MDWAGFEPAIFRLRIERPYRSGLPALIALFVRYHFHDISAPFIFTHIEKAVIGCSDFMLLLRSLAIVASIASIIAYCI